MAVEIAFSFPLAGGLHARPASRLQEEVVRFRAAVTFLNRASGASASARSVLALVATRTGHAEPCVLHVQGEDEAAAAEALRRFVKKVLPGLDEAPAARVPTGGPLPRALGGVGGARPPRHAGQRRRFPGPRRRRRGPGERCRGRADGNGRGRARAARDGVRPGGVRAPRAARRRRVRHGKGGPRGPSLDRGGPGAPDQGRGRGLGRGGGRRGRLLRGGALRRSLPGERERAPRRTGARHPRRGRGGGPRPRRRRAARSTGRPRRRLDRRRRAARAGPAPRPSARPRARASSSRRAGRSRTRSSWRGRSGCRA